MCKLIGIVLTFLSVFIFVYRPIYNQKQRISFLFSMIQFLKGVNNELRTNLSSISELLTISRTAYGESVQSLISCVLEDVNEQGAAAFKDSWKRNIRCYDKLLSIYEIELLSHLGDVLGRYILEEQVMAVDSVIYALEAGYQSELSECKASESFRVRLGVVVGAGLVILLI